MNYIHLKHYHTKTSRFKHPLTGNTKPLDIEALNREATLVLYGKDPEELTLMLVRCVGLLVSRYLGNFPQTRKLVDEMVSEGMTAIADLLNRIPVDLFHERGILKIAESRAQNAIETMLNDMMALSSASARQQRYLMEADERPIYLQSESDDYNENPHSQDSGDEWKRDLLDALDMLQPQDDVEAAILNPLNWGRNNKEFACELGVCENTICRRKASLLERYEELTS